jgi:hypothetical protein
MSGEHSKRIMHGNSRTGKSRETSAMFIEANFADSITRPAVDPDFDVKRILLYFVLMCFVCFCRGRLPSTPPPYGMLYLGQDLFFAKSHFPSVLPMRKNFRSPSNFPQSAHYPRPFAPTKCRTPCHAMPRPRNAVGCAAPCHAEDAVTLGERPPRMHRERPPGCIPLYLVRLAHAIHHPPSTTRRPSTGHPPGTTREPPPATIATIARMIPAAHIHARRPGGGGRPAAAALMY